MKHERVMPWKWFPNHWPFVKGIISQFVCYSLIVKLQLVEFPFGLYLALVVQYEFPLPTIRFTGIVNGFYLAKSLLLN